MLNFQQQDPFTEWQEKNKDRAFLYITADENGTAMAQMGGHADTLALSLACIIGKRPVLREVLQSAINLAGISELKDKSSCSGI